MATDTPSGGSGGGTATAAESEPGHGFDEHRPESLGLRIQHILKFFQLLQVLDDRLSEVVGSQVAQHADPADWTAAFVLRHADESTQRERVTKLRLPLDRPAAGP